MTLVPPRPAPPAAAADAAVRASTPLVLRVLFVGLMLYAAFGKGFAYAGWPPVFVGEVLLAVVVAAAVRPWAAIPRNAAALVTAGLVGLAIVQFAIDLLVAAVPLQETLRGLAPIAYSAYAFGVFALLRDHERRVGRHAVVALVQRGMTRATPWVLGAVVVLAALLLVEPAGLPTWPTSGVSLLLTKSGDIAVTLVLFASLLFSAGAAERFGARRPVLVAMWAGAALLVTFRSRGALLALIIGLVVMRPHVARITKVALAALAVVLTLYVSGLSIEVGGREISYDAVGDAVGSVLGAGPEDEIGSNYLDTTNWRADWWSDIWGDVRDERMVLHGGGWGDNLALRHGVTPSLAADDPRVLRLPHNIFFSLAGRAGLVTAIAFLLVPLLTIVRTVRGTGGGRERPLVEAARGGVAAAVVTGFSDIYLESPQGGILFWCLIGFLWWTAAPGIGPAPPSGDRPTRGVT